MSDLSNTAPAASSSAGADAITAAVAANVTFTTERIAEILSELYGDAGLAGGAVAAEQLGRAGGDFAELIPNIDWSKWVPGDPATASLIENGGLRRILDAIHITIKGLTDSAIDRLGNEIAAGIARGDSNQTIANSLEEILGSPKRAMVVARTETARVMGMSTLDTFAAEDIEEWTWNTTEGACPVCVTYEKDSPYPVGGGPLFPGHPNCRCDPRAVLDIDKA